MEVRGRLSRSEVIIMYTVCRYGSSRLLIIADHASSCNRWHSSIMKTLKREEYGTRDALLRSAFTRPKRSIFAASSSFTSLLFPENRMTHSLQNPHGLCSSRDTQLRAAAKIRAVDVFPVPRGP
uniref:Uncharacterized protein n=1 Tax=Arundo donax TaxID=35708 RepID=A0A0A9D1F0_ARUDO